MDSKENLTSPETFPKNDREVVGVGVKDDNGKRVIFIRIFRQLRGEGELKETNKGIELSVEKYDALLQVMSDVGDVMISEKVVGKIDMDPVSKLWIGVNKAGNIPQIFFRVYKKSEYSKKYEPTEQGVSMRVEFYPYLLDALGKISTPKVEIEPPPVSGNPPVKCPYCNKKMKGKALYGHIKRVHSDISKPKKPIKPRIFTPGRRVTIDEHGFIVSHNFNELND